MSPFPTIAPDDALASFAHGWVPVIGYDAACPARPWFGEIRRGEDVILCGQHATAAEAWGEVARYGRMIKEVYESGDSTLLILLKASIKYGPNRA